MKFLFSMLLFFFVSSLFLFADLNCKKEDSGITNSATDTIPTPAGYTLVWNDEFTGTSVDKKKWEYEVNGDGGGNNELQYYTNLAENSYVENGILVIQALKKNYLGKEYTSARIRTKYKGDWTYGRFEIKAKLPYGQGLWPAIWMLPTDWTYGGWPESGEIDIMEMLGNETTKIYGTLHYTTNNQHQSDGGNYSLKSGTFAQYYHVFALEWDATGFNWYVDNNLYYTTKHTKPFDKRFHIILNVAVGGNWPGNPDASTLFPQKMFVDYVRVFTKK
ncbi:MAG: glycoside hydrolase family 16 protein [Ignavibacteriales bacterium]|nr:glycoside hydrolase family 16 protein [Ignavibacteriales bacterium]